MTSTAVAESEPQMDDAPRRFQSVEDMVIFHNPDWSYLTNKTLPVRDATEAELAEYAARYDDGDWREIYAPAEPRVILPPSDEVAALLDPPAAVPQPEPAPLPPPVLDEHTEAALARFNAVHDSEAADDDPVLNLDVEDELEVHHDKHDTQILHVPPAVSG